MKLLIAMALTAICSIAPASAQNRQEPSPESYVIVSDKSENGVRTIVATPSRMVCSRKIVVKVEEKTKKITDLEYTGGCSGNLNALCTLIKGMTVGEVIEKLDGNDCSGRGTSCMDQLCRILKTSFNIK